MADQDERPGFDEDPGDGDEVEILEVVGVDENGNPHESGADHAADEQTKEVALVFDDEGPPEPSERSRGQRGATDEEVLLRLRADYENLCKRIKRERDEFERRANQELVARLLPILDNFERALALGTEAPGNGFRAGCELIYKQLIDELRRQGLRPIPAVGEPFDPQVHDAVATDDGSDAPPNTIVEELRRGYLFQGSLLRPAMVRVRTNGGPEPGSESEAETEDELRG